MSRFSVLAVVCAAACGGGPKKQVDQPILPPEPGQLGQAGATPEAKPEPTRPAQTVEKAEPPKPAEVSLPTGETTVKLVSAGKGAKAKLVFAPKLDAKQHVEIAMDFHAKQDAQDDISPTMVLAGDATVKAGANGSYQIALLVSSATARDVAGSKLPATKLQPALASLVGMTIGGTVAANGTSSELALHVEHPDGMTGSALQLVGLAWPEWIALPSEPVGVGATWVATTKAHMAEKLEISRVATYELTAHTGSTWTLKRTLAVSGPDQDLDGAKASKIAGTGSGTLTLTDGGIYATGSSASETHFSVEAGAEKHVLSIDTGATIK